MSDVSIWYGSQEGAYKTDRTIITGYMPSWRYFLDSENKKFFAEINKQVVTLGDGKGCDTVNEIDGIKELNNYDSRFKKKRKFLNKKVT